MWGHEVGLRAALDGHAKAAQVQRFAAGEVLFYEGEPAKTLCLVQTGRVALSRGLEPQGMAAAGDLLDAAAVLGGLRHRVKAEAVEDVEVLGWPVAALWQSEAFAVEARRWLAEALHAARSRLETLEAPVNAREGALLPGPYLFEDVTMLFAFCRADPDAVRALLPPGVSLFRVPVAQRQGLVLLALADFPHAHPVDAPGVRMAPYTETTCFIPVRHRVVPGLFVPYIYPSAWEPILLGREIYGFPKRLGQTVFGAREAALRVDGAEVMRLGWAQSEPCGEADLVGELVGWLGLERHLGALAYQIGDGLLQMARLPAYRRVDVYNRKRILAAGATYARPVYAVDCLTRAAFRVERFYQVARMRAPVLAAEGGPFAALGLSLRAAYRTQLDLRLGAAQMVRDYIEPSRTGRIPP